jgi:hypothetical protein
MKRAIHPMKKAKKEGIEDLESNLLVDMILRLFTIYEGISKKYPGEM